MWALEPEAVGEDSRTLRIAFFSENVSFLESDLEEDFFEKTREKAEEFDQSNGYANSEYGKDDRDAEFTDGDRYIADFADDDEDDEDGDNNDDEDDDYKPTDRTGYVYH